MHIALLEQLERSISIFLQCQGDCTAQWCTWQCRPAPLFRRNMSTVTPLLFENLSNLSASDCKEHNRFASGVRWAMVRHGRVAHAQQCCPHGERAAVVVLQRFTAAAKRPHPALYLNHLPPELQWSPLGMGNFIGSTRKILFSTSRDEQAGVRKFPSQTKHHKG